MTAPREPIVLDEDAAWMLDVFASVLDEIPDEAAEPTEQ